MGVSVYPPVFAFTGGLLVRDWCGFGYVAFVAVASWQTNLLTPALVAGAPSRVINVSSMVRWCWCPCGRAAAHLRPPCPVPPVAGRTGAAPGRSSAARLCRCGIEGAQHGHAPPPPPLWYSCGGRVWWASWPNCVGSRTRGGRSRLCSRASAIPLRLLTVRFWPVVCGSWCLSGAPPVSDPV